MKIFFALLVMLSFLLACKNRPNEFEYIRLDEFKYTPIKIEDNTTIHILSFSGGPACSTEETYYFQYIGVIDGTTDTVRVLSPCQKLPVGEQPTKGTFTNWGGTAAIIEKVMDQYGEGELETENKIVVINKLNADLEKREFKTVIGTLSF